MPNETKLKFDFITVQRRNKLKLRAHKTPEVIHEMQGSRVCKWMKCLYVITVLVVLVLVLDIVIETNTFILSIPSTCERFYWAHLSEKKLMDDHSKRKFQNKLQHLAHLKCKHDVMWYSSHSTLASFKTKTDRLLLQHFISNSWNIWSSFNTEINELEYLHRIVIASHHITSHKN